MVGFVNTTFKIIRAMFLRKLIVFVCAAFDEK